MTANVTVMSGAEPYSATGDRRGALVLHGFTGSPQSMRPLGEAFARAGFTVDVVRLPGHGTTVEEMAATDFSDWSAAVDGAKAILASGHAYLPGVAGDIADPQAKELGYDKAPAAALISLVDAMQELKPLLPSMKMPVLLMRSAQDHIIPPGSAQLIRNSHGGEVEFIELTRSFHVATIDYDGPEINRLAVSFGEQVSA